ncbi:DNA cytosine methyltransferase [Janibacter cremeus]|uniref:DNA cytosine methyltransferase n=1 Tax=Janibacter cremeus TaxID=1285192 RepID=UPI0023F853ED|nr:DNA cytosine methyltransferase [Janibacter cremeus]WEV78614.1 DNA cytosine methyltransferase [Janibacter cremeus]
MPAPPPEVTQPEITTIDLFAGAGGLTEGLKQAGRFRPVAAVEMDLAASATFAQNHGDVVHVGDITEWVDSGEVPEADVVVGGPPCQGFSRLNRYREGDERNLLWRYYMETVRLARPRYFVLENVAAMFNTPEFAMLQDAFTKGGLLEDYTIDADVLNAADFGAAQTRRRAIVLGRRRDLPEVGLPEATHDRDTWVPAATVFDRTSPQVRRTEFEEVRTLTFRDQVLPGPYTTRELHITRKYAQLSLDRFRAIPPGGNRFSLPDELLSPCWRKHTTGAGDVMGRMHLDRPSVTVRTEFFKPEKGRYLHPTANRAITHKEAALLQGFPDHYIWIGSKTQIARQIGNAVPVRLGEAIGRQIVAASSGAELSTTRRLF